MKALKKITLFFFMFVLYFCLGYFLNLFISNNFIFKFKFDKDILVSSKTLLYSFELFMVFVVMYLFVWYKGYYHRNSKKFMESTKKDNHILSGLEQAHFQSDKELEKNFSQIEYDNLPKTNIEGIPIKAEQNKKNYKISFAKSAHTLIIGTTGSGKTTTFINPGVQILSHTQNKPSMLISDPKGELYALHTKSLLAHGYEVKVLDLRNPYCSIRWNPLERPFMQYQKMLRLENEVTQNEEEGYFIFENKMYYDLDEKNAAVQVRKQEIYDEVYEDLHDIVSVLCPVKNKSEPIWESGAKNFILAITLAMLEDSENPELGMTKEKFNFFNIMKIATNTQNDCEDLMEYFKGRSPISKCVSLSKQVLDASDKTRGSYLSTIFDKLSMFADMSICSLTSANEIDFGELALKPTALFLQIPDEKETRHTLAAMVILQAYKELVSKANSYPDLSLPRSVYFLLDEFGNLPRVHKLEQMITVGRSRKIWLSLVIQSYAQLAKVYDDKSADIIKSNCNIQIFIGTTDLKTIEDFSKLCGNYSIVQRNVSLSSSNDNVSSSASIKERPLIYPTELQQLNSPNNMGNAIVNVFGFSPVKSKFTPSYKCTKYKLDKTVQTLGTGKYFNEEKVFYNLLERNEKINPKINIKKPKSDVAPFIESLKIQVEKLSMDIFGTADIKLQLLKSLENKEIDKIISLLKEIEERTSNQNADEQEIIELNQMIRKAEQIKNLGG